MLGEEVVIAPVEGEVGGFCAFLGGFDCVSIVSGSSEIETLASHLLKFVPVSASLIVQAVYSPTSQLV